MYYGNFLDFSYCLSLVRGIGSLAEWGKPGADGCRNGMWGGWRDRDDEDGGVDRGDWCIVRMLAWWRGGLRGRRRAEIHEREWLSFCWPVAAAAAEQPCGASERIFN